MVDTRLLWEERQRLIEDLRHLADEVLGTADDALERLKLPEPLAAAEQDPEPTTAEDVRPIPHPLSIARSGPVEAAPENSDPSVPYDMGAEEDDPETTQPWLVEAEDDEDPDATVAYAIGQGEDEDEPDEEPAADQDGDDDSGGTIELEALPGGNADEQPGERERD